MPGRLALVVGIDHYSVTPLTTCVNDARSMGAALRTHADDGTENFVVSTLVSEVGKPIGRQVLMERLGDLFNQPEDWDLLFYFSGHGRNTALGPELATEEVDAARSGVSMDQIAATANRNPHRSLTIILDCCFAGAAGEILPSEGEALERIQLARGAALLAASRDVEAALVGKTHSMFTASLLDGLNGAAADFSGRVTPASLHALADASFFREEDQRPVLKVYSDTSLVLRRCPSGVSSDQMALLGTIFGDGPEPAPELPRELVWAVSNGQNVADEVRAVQAFVRAGLVEARSDGADSSKVRIRLTALGQHYWRLSVDGAFA